MDNSVKSGPPDDRTDAYASDPAAKAAELGLDLVLPEADEVLLDIDDINDYLTMQRLLTALNDRMGVGTAVVHKETRSKNNNWHVYVRFNRALSDLERVALQACLGSDRMRECLALTEVFTHADRPPSVFFEVPSGSRDP